MGVCKYCGREYGPDAIKKHLASCLSNEELIRYVKSEIRRECPLGVLMSWRSYWATFSNCEPVLPSPAYLTRQLGSWDAVAKWAGLLPSSQMEEVRWRKTREFVAELAHRLHDNEYGPSILEYDGQRPDYLPASDELIARFFTWGAVLTWGGGFKEGDVGYYIFCQYERELRAMSEVRIKLAARKRLMKVEQRLVAEAEATGGMKVNGAPKTGFLYDWRTHFYYECTATELR